MRNPDGTLVPGILLHTALQAEGKRWFLLLTVHQICKINAKGEAFLWFMGGFDRPSVAFDHSLDLRCLMFFYPYRGDLARVIEKIGSIDL